MDDYKVSDVKINLLTKHDRKLLTKYESDRYKELEALKVKIKDM